MRVIKWVNDTLDAAAAALGPNVTREAAMALLILYKNDGALSGKKLVQLYRAWNAAPNSPAIEESVRVAQGQLLQGGFVEVGAISGKAVSKLKHDSFQQALGAVLEKGVQPLKRIHVTSQGKKRIDMMRETIDESLNSVLKTLKGQQRREFEKLITGTLPYPPAKLPTSSAQSDP